MLLGLPREDAIGRVRLMLAMSQAGERPTELLILIVSFGKRHRSIN